MLITVAFVFQVRTEKPRFIWCAWEELAKQIPADQPQTVYVFEDLVAYHFWFATRNNANFQIVKVNEMPGMTEDKAYFLPRGFNGVRSTTPDEIVGGRFSIAFRDTQWDERHPPLIYFSQRAFKIEKPQTIESSGLKAFLVEITR